MTNRTTSSEWMSALDLGRWVFLFEQSACFCVSSFSNKPMDDGILVRLSFKQRLFQFQSTFELNKHNNSGHFCTQQNTTNGKTRSTTNIFFYVWENVILRLFPFLTSHTNTIQNHKDFHLFAKVCLSFGSLIHLWLCLACSSNSLANFNCYKTLFMFKTIASLSLAYLFLPQFPKPYCSSGLRRLLAFVIKNWPIANTMIMSMKLSLCSISLSLCLCFSLFALLYFNQSQNWEHSDPWWHATQPFEMHCIQNSENEFKFFFSPYIRASKICCWSTNRNCK